MPDSFNPRRRGLAAAVGALLLASSACVSTSAATYPADAPARPGDGIPERFMVGTIPAGGPLSEPEASASCRNPMVDPRDGTQLRLVRSQPGENGQVGDYDVPDGQYGAATGELLRIHCATGRAIGLVPERP